MLKVFSAAQESIGQDPATWDTTWASVNLQQARAAVADDFLAPYFRRYLTRQGVNLEGGCGTAHYVMHYADLGYPVVGVDFATGAVRRARQAAPKAPLVVGDVSEFPVRDDSVTFYYSGGVVEHFEEGPHRALQEAHRILAPGGHLLITVPYENLVRRHQFRSGLQIMNWEGHILERVACFGATAPPKGMRFMEYRFTASEFRTLLQESQFEVVKVRPFSLLAGEFSRLLAIRRRGETPTPIGHDHLPVSAPAPRGSLKQYVVDVLSKEKLSGAPFRPLVRALSHLSAHMVMFVCRPMKRATPNEVSRE